jgi:hypothetical protein
VAFDGANIWVTNAPPGVSEGAVTKLRASDGAVLLTFNAGITPSGLAFDGANIWVAKSFGVIKLRASDGKMLGTFPVGCLLAPQCMAFDGANIWVADHGSNTASKL